MICVQSLCRVADNLDVCGDVASVTIADVPIGLNLEYIYNHNIL